VRADLAFVELRPELRETRPPIKDPRSQPGVAPQEAASSGRHVGGAGSKDARPDALAAQILTGRHPPQSPLLPDAGAGGQDRGEGGGRRLPADVARADHFPGSGLHGGEDARVRVVVVERDICSMLSCGRRTCWRSRKVLDGSTSVTTTATGTIFDGSGTVRDHRGVRSEAMGFSKVSDQYERGRPGYPPAAVEWIAAGAGLAPAR